MALDLTIRPPLNPVQPGAFSAVDASALREGQGPAAPIVAVVGACTGGPPNTALFFRDPQALKSVLRSGPAYDAARFALGAGSLPVAVVRAGAGILQSTKALAGATGSPVTLTSLDYGAWTVGIKATVEANNKVTISFTDDFGITYNEVFDLGSSATAQQVVDAINGKTPGIGKSNLVSAAVTTGTMPLTAASISALSSGADGTLAGGDWTTALTVLETEEVSVVVPATGDASVHAQVVTHCDNMSSTIARRERTGEFGAVSGESVAQQETRMNSLRNKRAGLSYPGIYLYSDKGVLTLYDPFYLAALLAGTEVAQDDAATPLTHHQVEVVDVEKRLSTLQGSDVDRLLRAGVTPLTPKPGGGFWLADSLSGYNTDEIFRDRHKVRTADEVARRLRTRLEDVFVGGKVLDGSQGDIATEAGTECQKMLDEELIRAFKDALVQPDPQNQQSYLVSAPVVLPDTLKYIFITVALQPASAINRAAAVPEDALT